MSRILPVPIPQSSPFDADIPSRGEIVDVTLFNGAPHLLVRGDPALPYVRRRFHMVPHGKPIPIGCDYVGHFKFRPQGAAVELLISVFEQADVAARMGAGGKAHVAMVPEVAT